MADPTINNQIANNIGSYTARQTLQTQKLPSQGDQTPEVLGGPTDRRTLNVMLGTGFLNQVDQTRKTKNERGAVTGEKKQFLPLPLRILSAVGGLILLVGCIGMVLYFMGSFASLGNLYINDPLVYGINLAIGVTVYGGLRLLESYLERQDWIRRMREADEAKKK